MLRPGAIATPTTGSSVVELARVALTVSQERTLPALLDRIQREAVRLTQSLEALCVVLDGRGAWTLHGAVVDPAVVALVTGVARSGPRAVGNALFEAVRAHRPLAVGTGSVHPQPAPMVIAIRRLAPYGDLEAATLASLARAIAPAVARYV